MPKENYRPWHIDMADFPSHGKIEHQLKFILGFAILAPSGHNSQPWNFDVEDDRIDILVNEERSLAQSDPERRQLYVSLGCALENLIVAGKHFGFHCEVTYFPNHLNQNLVARVVFSKDLSRGTKENNLASAIKERRTNRGKYVASKEVDIFLDLIEKFSEKGIKISIVTDQKIKAPIADIVNTAQIEVMEEDYFREELSHYIKSNITKSKTGMPGFTLGLPLPISFIASKLIRRVNMSKKTIKQDDALLKKYTPAFVIISTEKDDAESKVRAGQLFERIWLMATKDGLSCAPLAAGVQVGEYYRELQKVLGISSRPQIFFRIGRAKKIPKHSPRMSVEEVLI